MIAWVSAHNLCYDIQIIISAANNVFKKKGTELDKWRSPVCNQEMTSDFKGQCTRVCKV